MIEEYIIAHFKKKLKENPVLVVYDPENRYHQITLSLSDTKVSVFDVSESAIIAKENASEYFSKTLPTDESARMVVYIPFEAPTEKQQRIRDPFSVFSLCGNVFPANPEDRYIELCKAYFPDKEQQIDELFTNEQPDFGTINALADGTKWAKLETVTGGKSPKEIILTLLLPTEAQQFGLKNDKTWNKEWQSFANSVFDLKSQGKDLQGIQGEIWKHLLYSEFIFDLPVDLPDQLKSVPRADISKKALILDVCKSIRHTKYIDEIYIDNANKVADLLELPKLFRNAKDLGQIVTFAFEDNTYFANFVEQLKEGEFEKAKSIIDSNSNNVWVSCDKERALYWNIAKLALNIVKQINTNTDYKKCKKASDLIEFYATKSFEIDQNQRQFERCILDILSINEMLEKLIVYARKQYREYAEDSQKVFQSLVVQDHWPIESVLANVQVFDKIIAPEIKAKRKIAYLLVDALRFELAKEIEKQIEKHFQVEVTPSCAYLPTITQFGMAALLPDASSKLHLDVLNDKLEAWMVDKPLCNLSQRSDFLREKFGDLCEVMNLDQFLSNEVDSKTQLLIITTNEIDTAGEHLEANALIDIQRATQKLVKSFYRIKEFGFPKAVVVTDHGFVLHPCFEAGDNTSKPMGEWVLAKSRCLVGTGTSDNATLSFTPENIGVRSSVPNFIFGKNYVVFEKNKKFFHEGISLQETVLPVMQITFRKDKVEKSIEIHLTYKGKDSGNITTRRPAIELSSFSRGEINFETVSIKIEAMSNGKLIGLPVGNKVNPSNNLIEFIPGESFKLTLAMDEDFEGSFDVIALDPVTNKTFSTITLKTAYL